MRFGSIAVLLAALLVVTPVAAKEEADFIEGTFATAEGCDKLKKLAEGAEKNIKSVPETLTKSGFQGWEFSCEFTKVFQHNRNTWVGLMYCVDGGTIGVTNMLFVKENDKKIDVINQNEEGADEFERCEIKPASAKTEAPKKADDKKPETPETKKADEEKPEEKKKTQ